MEILNDYIVVVVMAICLCVGYILKNVVPTDKVNRYIPLIMGVLGVVLNVWMNFLFTPEILLGGLASGLAATGAFEAGRNLINKEEK